MSSIALTEELRLARFKALRQAGRDLLHDHGALFGLCVIVLLVVVALAGPWLTPHDPTAVKLSMRLRPPAWLANGQWAYPLGTDHLGRDVLSRIIYGGRVSLFVGVAVVFLAGVPGTILGTLAGYFGGRTDAFIMRAVDTQIAFPGLLIALLMLTMIGPSVATLVLVLSFNGWMIYARMARSVALSARALPYVEAAELLGCSRVRVMGLHLFPNLISPMSTLAVLEFARIILAEASLSFLGVGIQPPASSWGLDITSGRNYIFQAWWLVTFPGVAIAVSVLGANLFASWLKLQTDPNEREKMFARNASAKAS
jgi:ABC-type dipeptide/oligopeptide/nickel transport system permease subunit